MTKEIRIDNRNDIYGATAKYKGYNLFIEAGAGAGKTESIIYLVMDQLLNNVPPEKIIVITFTNKATEELIDRVSSELLKKLNDDKTLSEEERLIIQNAINNSYKMNISTIHHLCNVILSENSYLAKLSYGSTLLEEDDETKRREYHYNQWFGKLNKDDFSKLYNCDITKSDGKADAIKELRKTYTALCDQFDDVNINNDFTIDYKSFFDSIQILLDYLDDYNNLGAFAQKFKDEFSNILSKRTSLGDEELVKEVIREGSLDKINRKIQLNKSNDMTSDELKEVNDYIKELVEPCAELKDLIKDYIKIKDFSIVNEYAIDAWKYYKTNRDKQSLCNNQLIYEVYKLFKDNDEVKEKLANKYDVIIVDEFQDTDKYQNKFVMDLAVAIDNRKQKEGKQTTSLVLVGDPKQSIYAFRGADFDLFMDTKERFTKLGLQNAINVFFPDNYRSNQFILGWVNEKFATVNEFYPGYEYKSMIIPDNNRIPEVPKDKILGGVYSYNFNADDNKFNNLANFIKKLVDDKYMIYKKPSINAKFEEREIQYKDILILTTSLTEINEYVFAFNKANIKTLVSGVFDLTSSKSFRYLYRTLLYVLDEQNNNVRLEKELELTASKLEYLSELKEKIKDYNAYAKMIYVFNHIDLIIDNFDDSDKELLNTILVQVSENIAYNTNASSIQIIDAIDDLLNSKVDSQLMLNNNTDAVTIMNVHKSKGLTKEIVIFVDSGGFNKSNGGLVQGEYYLNNIKLFPEKEEISKDNKEKEKYRLEYVAATRAKQVMIFESNMKKNRDKGVQLFDREGYYYALDDLENNHLKSSKLPEIDTTPEEETENWKQVTCDGFTQASDDLKHINYLDISPSSLETRKEINKEDYVHSYKRPANNTFGTMFHRTMELCILSNSINLEKIVNRVINENIELINPSSKEYYKRYLIECANAVLKLYNDNNILNEYKSHTPEFKFYDFSDDLYSDKPTLINGSIDLLLINDNKALIIDYKTDTNVIDDNNKFEQILLERYKNQLDAYKKVISRYKDIDIKNIITKIVWIEEKDNTSIAHLLTIE